MTNWEFTVILFLVAYFAGFIGALTGLGGGVVLIPVLSLFFKIDLRFAMGASLIAVMATSSGASYAFIQQRLTNFKIGMFLEVGTAIGAIIGALLLGYLPVSWISILFGIVLLFSVWFSWHRREIITHRPSHPWAKSLSLEDSYLTDRGYQKYPIYRVPLGFGLMSIAGMLSGLLGIGSGAFKVLALDLGMGLPYKVATSTSNFMIGMTAAASAGIYLSAGYIYPELVFPVTLGVLMGAVTGAKFLVKAAPQSLRRLFAFILLLMALQMIREGWMLL